MTKFSPLFRGEGDLVKNKGSSYVNGNHEFPILNQSDLGILESLLIEIF